MYKEKIGNRKRSQKRILEKTNFSGTRAGYQNHVLGAANDVSGAVVRYVGGVSRVVPPIGRNLLPRALLIVIVAAHVAVASQKQLSLGASGHDLTLVINDQQLHVIHHVSDVLDALGGRVIESGHRHHRRHLCTALEDREIAHAEFVDESIAEGEGARSTSDVACIERVDIESPLLDLLQMLQNVDEHRGSAVERRTMLLRHNLECLERIEASVGEYGSLLVGEGVEDAHRAAEAVVERIGNADDVVPVVVHEAEALEVRVVQQIVVGERRSLRVACCATRVLYVDGVIDVNPLLDRLQSILRCRANAQHQILVLPGSLHVVVLAEHHDVLEIGEIPALDVATARLGRSEIGDDLLECTVVVALLVGARRDQAANRHLLEGEAQLLRLVRWIDVDLDESSNGRSHLARHPLVVVRAPDAHDLTGFQSQLEQGAREAARVTVRLRV
ncbi:hypothetical protein PMAYCL1PPCAC_05029 [Pristionchus mayeri]|uniref:Uncharacterized protein n=1 Tax=Pristionchus mayeri TaxID=1317129 RepID=A0AAN5CAG6_9BILA|nr:hypothetical protein PMAYCL1PPCAC_05029 [Pristionchus mayeri]